MGLVVTLFLISVNVYNSVQAPSGRGFSYIELWMVGMQIPILLAILEYSLILGVNRYSRHKNIPKIYVAQNTPISNTNYNLASNIYSIDIVTCILSMLYYILFCILYWTVVP